MKACVTHVVDVVLFLMKSVIIKIMIVMEAQMRVIYALKTMSALRSLEDVCLAVRIKETVKITLDV